MAAAAVWEEVAVVAVVAGWEEVALAAAAGWEEVALVAVVAGWEEVALAAGWEEVPWAVKDFDLVSLLPNKYPICIKVCQYA
jgi:hypothetical protein